MLNDIHQCSVKKLKQPPPPTLFEQGDVKEKSHQEPLDAVEVLSLQFKCARHLKILIINMVMMIMIAMMSKTIVTMIMAMMVTVMVMMWQ